MEFHIAWEAICLVFRLLQQKALCVSLDTHSEPNSHLQHFLAGIQHALGQNNLVLLGQCRAISNADHTGEPNPLSLTLCCPWTALMQHRYAAP